MAFGGHCGLKVDISHKTKQTPVEILFAEEVGWVLEVGSTDIEKVLFEFKKSKVPCYPIGVSSESGPEARIEISVLGTSVVDAPMVSLLESWEETSYQLEKRQANPIAVTQEYQSYRTRKGPTYKLAFDPRKIPISTLPSSGNKNLSFLG